MAGKDVGFVFKCLDVVLNMLYFVLKMVVFCSSGSNSSAQSPRGTTFATDLSSMHGHKYLAGPNASARMIINCQIHRGVEMPLARSASARCVGSCCIKHDDFTIENDDFMLTKC